MRGISRVLEEPVKGYFETGDENGEEVRAYLALHKLLPLPPAFQNRLCSLISIQCNSLSDVLFDEEFFTVDGNSVLASAYLVPGIFRALRRLSRNSARNT